MKSKSIASARKPSSLILMEKTDADGFLFFRAQVIQCLADLMLADVLKKTNSVREECRDELKFELLQRVRRVDLFQREDTTIVFCL